MISSPTLPTRRDDVLLVDDGSDCVVAVPDQSSTLLLNPTARAIWELCDGRTRPDEMIVAICDLFDVGRGTAQRDVTAALAAMTHVGLVVWAQPGTGGPR